MEYIILKEGTIKNLISLVNDFISDGWKPLGSVSSIQTVGTTGEYLQAMTKEEKKEGGGKSE